MIVMRFSILQVLAVGMLSLCLTGCGKSESYRYKLTLAVNTPAGVKRGSSVVEVSFYEVSVPARGTMHKLHGEALYLDLGSGARPLIALLTSRLQPKNGRELRWSGGAGPDDNLLSELYGVKLSAGLIEYASQLSRMRGAHKITTNDLPDLVTFADVSDPKSVLEVNPNDLQATLGQGVTWNEITLESTNEPITSGLRTKLPWIEAYFQENLRLDGQNLKFPKSNLANNLGWADFDLSGDLKRK